MNTNVINSYDFKNDYEQVIIHDHYFDVTSSPEGSFLSVETYDSSKLNLGSFKDYDIENLISLGINLNSKIDTSTGGSRSEIHKELVNFSNNLPSDLIIKEETTTKNNNINLIDFE